MTPADYFNPAQVTPISLGVERSATLMSITRFFRHGKPFPIIKPGSIVVLGVPESRNSSNAGAAKAPDLIRAFLYGMAAAHLPHPVVDAGNLKPTKSPAESYAATRDMVDKFLGQGATVLVLGGTQELTFSLYQGVKPHRKRIGLAIIDSGVDMAVDENDFCSTSYITKLAVEPAENLFDISVIGYQGYLVNPAKLSKLGILRHECIRLGAVRGNFQEVEPTFRNSDIVSVDLGAIRNSDSPGNITPSPNGLYAEEACQLSRFAGLSDRTCCFGVFEQNSLGDPGGQSAHMAAQLCWHFIEAFGHRKHFFPFAKSKEVKKFIVDTGSPGVVLSFYKNQINDTWWMEIPLSGARKNEESSCIFACSYNDYLAAGKRELPERWLRLFSKLD